MLARTTAHYFVHLGTVGFGLRSPAAWTGNWLRKRDGCRRQDYVEGLAFSQLSPGPLAAQLAMYIGWVRAGRLGAALVAFAFISPSFLMAIGIAALYIRFERLPWIEDLFYGVGAAVIAIIGQSAYLKNSCFAKLRPYPSTKFHSDS
jgi:chromate transporter